MCLWYAQWPLPGRSEGDRGVRAAAALGLVRATPPITGTLGIESIEQQILHAQPWEGILNVPQFCRLFFIQEKKSYYSLFSTCHVPHAVLDT